MTMVTKLRSSCFKSFFAFAVFTCLFTVACLNVINQSNQRMLNATTQPRQTYIHTYIHTYVRTYKHTYVRLMTLIFLF
jgi:hypothetical protein